MSIWIFLRRWLLRRFTQLSGRTVAVFVFSYLLSSWLFLSLAGEQALTSSFTDFVYYLMVTASTVGYGDMSPTTPAGKWIVALWVIPGGLSLFAMGIGQIASLFLDVWQHQLKGRRSLTVQNHYLVLGWNDQRTLHLINLLQHGEHGNRSIVLAVRPEMDNPLPGEIEFVRVPSFTDKAGMDKTNVAQASTIIIDNPEDDITLSAILYCVNQNRMPISLPTSRMNPLQTWQGSTALMWSAFLPSQSKCWRKLLSTPVPALFITSYFQRLLV